MEGGTVMSPSPLFAHPVRDPPGRVSRLCEDLSSLGRRLCEGIAMLAGRHAGDAVRDAVEAALGSAPPDPDSPGPLLRSYQDHRDSRYREPHRDRLADEQYDRYCDYRTDDDPWTAATPEPALPSCVAPDFPPAWWSLLPPALQLLAWWLRRQSRRPVETALEFAAATVVAYLAIGPVASALVATAGTALTLSGLIGGLRDVTNGLASH